MKRQRFIWAIFGAALMVVGCSQSTDQAMVDGSTGEQTSGQVSFSCSVQSAVDLVTSVTKADNLYEIPEGLIPSTDDVTVSLSGSYVDSDTEETMPYSYGPLLVSEYNESLPMIVAGSDYSAEFYYGEQGAEGDSTPYFSGSVDFEVIARGAITEEVALTLQNSIICLECDDDLFSEYYSNATFTVETSLGNSFVFSLPSDRIIFVEAGTTLTLSGSATKVRTGESVTFSAAEIGQTTARTMSRISIEAGDVGGGGLTIALSEAIMQMAETTVELNPQE